MSNLEKYHGPVFLDDAAMLEIMFGRTLPRLFMDYFGESLVVILLTDVCLIKFSLIPKETSRMNHNRRHLCGISDTGEILKFGGILFLTAFNLITVANPYFTFSNIYCLRVVTAIFVFTETWGPRLSDAMMRGTV